MKKQSILTIFLAFVLLFVWAVPVAENKGDDDPKSRMKERAPQIAKLKSKGVVGENNRGYLGFVGEKKEQEGLVKAENKDREIAHQAIAKKEKTSLETVEKFMAKKRAERAKPGEWLQDANGKWFQKKQEGEQAPEN